MLRTELGAELWVFGGEIPGTVHTVYPQWLWSQRKLWNHYGRKTSSLRNGSGDSRDHMSQRPIGTSSTMTRITHAHVQLARRYWPSEDRPLDCSPSCSPLSSLGSSGNVNGGMFLVRYSTCSETDKIRSVEPVPPCPFDARPASARLFARPQVRSTECSGL
jgi:hypothetical protein